MKISDAIVALQELLDKHGDVEVVTDCERCGAVTTPNQCVAGKPTARFVGHVDRPGAA